MSIRLCGILNCQYYDNAERCIHSNRVWLTCRRCGRRAVFTERELTERPPLEPIGIPQVIGMDEAIEGEDKTHELAGLAVNYLLPDEHTSPQEREDMKKHLMGELRHFLARGEMVR